MAQALSGRQRPRISHVPDGRLRSRGTEAIEFARSYGLELDPWQQLVLKHGCRMAVSDLPPLAFNPLSSLALLRFAGGPRC